MATKLIKDLPLVETLTDTDAVLIQTDNGTQRASLAQIKEVSKGDKGEKGEQGEKGDSGIMPTDMVDYMGNQHESLKDKADSDVEYILGEVNTVHYEGQTITATDTIERQVRSAILKGQTLVNVANTIQKPWNNNEYALSYDKKYTELSVNTENVWYQSCIHNTGLIKQSTTYLAIVEVIENTLTTDFSLVGNASHGKFLDSNIRIPSSQTGVFKIKLNSKSIFELDSEIKYDLFMQFGKNESVGNKIKFRLMLIEYQDGMENWDIPYFEGMQSVRMPVLSSTGKNLFSSNEAYRFASAMGEMAYADVTKICKDFIGRTFEHGVTFRAKITKENLVSIGSHHFGLDICFQCSDGTEVWSDFTTFNLGSMTGANSQTFTYYNRQLKGKTVVGVKKCRIFMRNLTGKFEMWDIEMYDGTLDSIPLTYEPYKSNILSTPQDLELRGIGDVQDTLDCLTGEVTEHVGEIVLDGSNYEWILDREHENNLCFRCYDWKDVFKANGKVLCDKFTSNNVYDNDNEGIYLTGVLRLGILKSKLSTLNVDGLNDYLSRNPITVQYQLATESIKTVDLNNQKVYSYDGTTHYTCSSAEGSLVPTLSIDVPTNLPALVSRQRQTIAEQSQTLAEQEEAQNILIDSQLSWYEATAPMTLNLTDEVQIPEYIQKLYKLAYERGIRDSSNAIIEQDLRID